jgi:nickel-dependent lactate racemase
MIGNGYADCEMSPVEATELVNKALENESWDGKRILLILPDLTRSAPIPLVYKSIYECIADKVECLDALIALGTHYPLSMERMFQRVGITREEYDNKYIKKTSFFNHEYNNVANLVDIGIITSEETKLITNGNSEEKVNVTINRKIFDYDYLMVIGPVFPHEVVGFSGGNKYFFPGICGEEIINMFHWMGAMITNAEINGVKDTPVRRILNRAAQFIKIPKLYFNLVANHGELRGLYIGDDIDAWGEAANLSEKVNVKCIYKKYKTVFGIAPVKYDDLWTAGKVAYKSETVVEDGGSIIIYAPHLKEVSLTHGKEMEEIGYHVKDYYAKRLDKFSSISPTMMAHSTHVKGRGSYINNVEKPRVNVILATGISRELCEKLNLGYLDPDSVNVDEWKCKEDEGVLFIPDAGEVLYKYVET